MASCTTCMTMSENTPASSIASVAPAAKRRLRERTRTASDRTIASPIRGSHSASMPRTVDAGGVAAGASTARTIRSVSTTVRNELASPA